MGIRDTAAWTMSMRAKRKLTHNDVDATITAYLRRFKRYAFEDHGCTCLEQFEASITRLYHTVEKGLAHKDFRAGSGRKNIDSLVASMEQYALEGYDTSEFFYRTALSCLGSYIEANEGCGLELPDLKERVNRLPGEPNRLGGAAIAYAPDHPESMGYRRLVASRHSIRTFSTVQVSIETLEEAIALAQHTPSACNRQGWKTRIVNDGAKMKSILDNQNGNRGFGDSIDKLLVITADLRAQQREREIFQAFIDGGMYAKSVLDSLHSMGIGSIPLSASLTPRQERAVRAITGIEDAEVLILFIGVGNYPQGGALTTKSERRPPIIDVI